MLEIIGSFILGFMIGAACEAATRKCGYQRKRNSEGRSGSDRQLYC